MRDLIDRQGAIETLDRFNVFGYVEEKWEKLRDALQALPTAEPQWIPCSERLPEEDGQYLITVKYKHVNDSYEDVYAEHGEWYDGRWDMFCFGHCGEVEDIIAWLPLPQPYRGGKCNGLYRKLGNTECA